MHAICAASSPVRFHLKNRGGVDGMDVPSSFPAGALVLRIWFGNEHVFREGFRGCDAGYSGPQLSWKLKQKGTKNQVNTHHYS